MRKLARRIKPVQTELEHNLARVVPVEICHVNENQAFPDVQNSFWTLLALYFRFLTSCTVQNTRH